MGNVGSSGQNGGNRRRQNSRRNHPQPPPPPPPPQPPQPEITGNRYVFAAATPFPSTGYYQYHPPAPGYYPPPPPPPPLSSAMPMPMPLPAPYDHHHQGHHHANWTAGRYHYGPMIPPPATPYIEHQKAVTIRNDVNLKKESLRVERDSENPGKFLVAFTFDATVAGSILICTLYRSILTLYKIDQKNSSALLLKLIN